MDETLGRAIDVFRERGYHATSLADIKAATALASGSIYKAFKDKRELFLASFDRYVAQGGKAREAAADKGTTGREKLRNFLRTYVVVSSGAEGRVGCLVVRTAVEAQTLDDEIAGRVKAAMARTRNDWPLTSAWGARMGRSRRMSTRMPAPGLLLCVLQGMRVVGTTGRTRAQMEAVIEQAMKVVG